MNLHLYNTESREIEEVIGPSIRMYTCGPTIYDYAHIGNFRTYLFEDVLRRTLKFFGYSVLQVMNITDIDDKTIRGALQKGISLKDYTEPYRKAFFEDIHMLNIEPAEYYPEATQYLAEMIQLIECLLEKGVAYRTSNGSIYFSIQKDPTYGRLSHLNFDELKTNASGQNEADEYHKENAADFVLWKAYDPTRDGTIYYESPFGPGRPGWHIECSAMSMKILGPTIDIHCGGVDNIFPHHENEIAQSEACTGKRFVKHWVHAEHLLVDHKKMSKSLGNFYTLRDLIQKGYTGPQIRYLLTSSHYRVQLNFTLQGLEAAKASLERIEDFLTRIKEIEEKGKEGHRDLLKEADMQFRKALAEDLNIPSALATLFDLIREVNGLCDASSFSSQDAHNVLTLFREWDRVLGFLPLQEKEEPPSAEVMALLAIREQARKEKNYRLSDQMRKEIAQKGYVIEDTPQGARLKKRS